MIEFFNSNPMLLICVALILIFVVLFFVIKFSGNGSSPKKIKTDDGAGDTATGSDTEKLKGKVAKKTKTSNSDEVLIEEKPKSRVKKAKKMKNVEKVFKKEETGIKQVSENPEIVAQTSSITEEDLLKRMEFVKSSKKVSKLAKISEIVEAENTEKLDDIGDENLSFDNVEEAPKLSAAEERKAKYFKRDIRLSNFTNSDDYDKMFQPHISDRYLNIDASRHLDTSEEVIFKLYQRASDTVAGSDARVLSADDENYGLPSNRCGGIEAHVEKFRRENFANYLSNLDKEEDDENLKTGAISFDETTKLNPRTMILAEAVMDNKRNRRRRV